MPKAVDFFLSLEERTDLGIGEASGTPLSDHLVSIVFLQITHHAGSANRPNDSNPLQSNTDKKSTIKNIFCIIKQYFYIFIVKNKNIIQNNYEIVNTNYKKIVKLIFSRIFFNITNFLK